MKCCVFGLLSMCFLFTAMECEAAPTFGVFRSGDRYAIVGDSITEQTIYSRMTETYLRLATPDEFKLHIMQYGWSGQSAASFLERMDEDLGVFGPTVVSICFGMNDGAYELYRDEIGARYRESLTGVVQHCKALGVREIVVMSPGIVDQLFWRMNITWEQYNENLHALRDIAESVAKEEQVRFADVYTAMHTALEAGKQHYGPAFHLTFDGIHPKENGHLIMAWQLLKALGMSGDMGSVELDDGKAATIDTSHWPMCFYGDPSLPDHPENILPLIPFQEELNRFMLHGVMDGPATVRWGEWEYAAKAGELQRGLNLAAVFPRNPFTESYKKLDDLIREKQMAEISFIRYVWHGCRQLDTLSPNDKKMHKSIKYITSSLARVQKEREEEILKAVQSVKSEIHVEVAANSN